MPSKSKAQQKFMGMVHSLKKGEMDPKDASSSVKKAAQSMKKSDAKDYASTSHKGLPRKVKQEILKRLKEYASKMGTNTMGGDDYTSKKKGGLRDNDGYDNVDYNRDMPQDESIDEACWKGYKEVGGKIKNGKQVPNCVPESIDESMMSTIDQIRKDSKSVRDFIKKVLSDRDFRDMKSDKDFIKYLGSIYEGIEENFPSNWMQGRTSDYHTKLRGKKRDYDDTNFDKENSGQKDLEEATKPDFNSKGYKEASKLVAKLRSSVFRKMSDDDLDQFRMVLAQAFDLKEYGSRLTEPFLLPKDEDKLDGTPPSKDAIDSDLEEEYKRDYKDEYKKFQSSTKAKKYRAELNKYNRQKGTYGNGDGKDASHKGGKIVGFESESKNRGRREKSRLKKK
jgi:hypothetical protein